MVPWHPPYALISLIFSSLLVLRPIVLCFTTRFSARASMPFTSAFASASQLFRAPLLSSFATGLSVQIFLHCAVVKVQGSGIQSFDQTLKTIQSLQNALTVDLHDSRLPCSCSRSHAFLLFWQLFGSSASFPLALACSLSAVSPIDLG